MADRPIPRLNNPYVPSLGDDPAACEDSSMPCNIHWKVNECMQAHTELLVSRLRFLVVDDIPATCHVLFELLKAFGATSQNITLCTSFAQAKQHLLNEDIEVVIGDLYLGDGSGFDLLQLVRSSPDMKDAIFVLITKSPTEEVLRKARALSVSSILAKPISFFDLQEHLLYCLLTQGVASPVLRHCSPRDPAPQEKLLARFSAISKRITTRATSGFRKKG
jgi:CheY-like chemotaxis protein